MKNAIDLAVDLCHVFEGYRARPYLCPAGVPTIGYGSTFYPDGTKVKLTDPPITRDSADALLYHELQAILPHVVQLCPAVAGNTRRAAAIIDFAYNLGWPRLRASTLRRRINERDWSGARVEILRWTKAGAKVLPGLVKRRQAEAALLI